MKVVSITNDFCLTKGKIYEVIEESAGYYKVKIDNGNVAFRIARLFEDLGDVKYG